MSTALSIAFGALWIVVAFQTLVLLGLTRTVHRLQESGVGVLENEGLVGQPVPAFSAVTLGGEMIDETALRGAQSALLFVSPDCATCNVTLAELEALQARTGDNIVVFCRSTAGKCAQLADTYRLGTPMVVDEDLAFSRLFLVPGAPTAVLIGPEGQVLRYGQPGGGSGDLEEVMTAGAA